MKKLMILGAGVYQLPLIKKAKEMGIYTIVASVPGNYPGFEIADKVVYEDTTDKEAILAIARAEKIDGILTTGTDVAVVTIGYVCEKLGLKGVSRQAARISCSKSAMKDVLKKHGIRCAESRKIELDASIEDVHLVCLELGYPAVIKAVDSSGSRGITIVNSKADIERAIESVKKVTKSQEYLAEEFLSGEEFGADAYVLDDEVKMVIPHGKYVYYAETGVPIGHYLPYDNEGVCHDAIAQMKKAIIAMGYNNCAVNADIMLHNGKPYIIEIGARAGATCIPELISLYQGYDYYEKMIQASLGCEVDFERNAVKSKAGAAMLLHSEGDGILKKINIPDNADIESIAVDVKPGQFVTKFRQGPHRIGHIITSGEDLKDAESKLNAIMNCVKIELE